MSSDIQDAFRTAINVLTPIWYGTSDALERGKVLLFEHSTPPFVIVHPDDVGMLPAGVRHLRHYRPTQADVAKMMEEWREKEIIVRFLKEPKEERFVIRRRWSV